MSAFAWTAEAVRRALAVDDVAGAPDDGIVYTGVSTDTRGLERGNLFVALTGERFDAHAFLGEAMEAGAAGAVVSRPPDREVGVPLYVVPDTLDALGRLARHRRRAFPGPVIAITGNLISDD